MRDNAGDGLCTFDIVKKGSRNYELATALEIQAAAVSLLNFCVKDRGGQGGVAVNIGARIQERSPSLARDYS